MQFLESLESTLIAPLAGHSVSPLSLKPGDHVYVYRLLYTYSHHGIVVKAGTCENEIQIVHFDMQGVRISTLSNFISNSTSTQDSEVVEGPQEQVAEGAQEQVAEGPQEQVAEGAENWELLCEDEEQNNNLFFMEETNAEKLQLSPSKDKSDSDIHGLFHGTTIRLVKYNVPPLESFLKRSGTTCEKAPCPFPWLVALRALSLLDGPKYSKEYLNRR